jgi:hypothetical protein
MISFACQQVGGGWLDGHQALPPLRQGLSLMTTMISKIWICSGSQRRAKVVAMLAAVAVAGGLPGCGSRTNGPHRAVQGSVTLAGVPIKEGAIEFHMTGNGPKGLAGGAMIIAGRYSIPRAHGLLPGTYRVIIRSPAEAVPMVAPDMESPEGGKPVARPKEPQRYAATERIPPAYNEESTVEVEVLATGPNQFDFLVP